MREHAPFTHATTGDPYEGESQTHTESWREKGFKREAFVGTFKSYMSIYVSRINGVEAASLIDSGIEDELVRKVEQLSEGDAIPGGGIDGVNVAQDFALEVARTFKTITGPAREGVSDDPDILREQIRGMAAGFSMKLEDVPPTVELETLSLVDVEGKNTRLANRIVAVISKKLFEHPYFQGLEESYLRDTVHCLDINITKPLVSITGENPSAEELDAYMDLFINDVISEIDNDVVERNAMVGESLSIDKESAEDGWSKLDALDREETLEDTESRSPDAEEATPQDIIKGLVVADHDYLMLIAGRLKDKLTKTSDEE